jgi:DNA-binding NtrC family response regulator
MPCVVVVEDEEQVRVLAEAIVQDAGHRTVSAANVEEALALIQGDLSVEVLFTDINLVENGPSGIDLAREARAIRPKLHVLYTTGEVVTDGAKALMVEGSAVLAKPYTPDQLTAAITALLDS